MPQLGATFYPGGVDDYYMPEVIAPSPQRSVAVPISPTLPCAMPKSRRRNPALLHSIA